MTRDEALKAFANVKAPGSFAASVWIERFVALGMLTLDEPKSEPKKLEPWSRFEAIKCARAAYINTDDFVAGLEKMGWQIVEK